MDIELQEIRDFIAGLPPFDRLPEQSLEQLTRAITIRYLRRGKHIPENNEAVTELYILRQGAVSLYSKNDNLAGMLGEGDICTSFCSGEETAGFHIDVSEDTLVYVVSCEALAKIVKDHPSVSAFFKQTSAQRLKQAVTNQQQSVTSSSTLINTSIADVISGNVVSVDVGTSIEEAARVMTDNGVSSVLITEQDKPAGIITDRDLRSRCLASGLSRKESVARIMTSDIMHVSSSASAFDALMIMTRKHIHHLPVIDAGQLKGVLTSTDLIRHEGRNSVYLSSSIRKAETLEALVEMSKMLPELQLQLINMGGSAVHVGKAITAVTGAITRRLIEMAEEKFGPAPVPYAWVAGGSQARLEQSSHSDQDNALIISNDMRPADEAWFESMANFVCDGLNDCGYVYCPGDAMAKNPQWRQTQEVWSGYFDRWINTPEPKSLMLSSIFFDLRVIHGDKQLLRSLVDRVLEQTRNNQLFLAHMTANALHHRVPLGFFRDFVLVHDGKHDDTLDLKHNGIVPIIDMARIYALAEGIRPVNTIERLQQAAGTPTLSSGGAANLLDAFEFIGKLRMEHQARQIRNGEAPDNFQSPKELSRLEREHLKDAFKVVQTMQAVLEQRYQAGRLA